MNNHADVTNRPEWMQDKDELPHPPQDIPLWSESYMTYAYSPANQIGVCIHLGYRPDNHASNSGLWEETLVVALPDSKYLVARGFNARKMDKEISICGVSWRCDIPYQQWTKRFQGGAQLVSRDQLSSGPLADGLHRPINLELVCKATYPPNDYGQDHKDESSAWETNGHYEQFHHASGYLIYDGKRIDLDGPGWRDHSWGPRNLLNFGKHTWLSAQFPSGRALMAVLLQGPTQAEPFVHALLYENGRLSEVTISDMPIANNISETESDFECQITTKDGPSTIRALIQQPIRLAMLGTNQVGIGTNRGPDAHHDWVSCFTRFEWDGEIGYGSSERSVDLPKQEK